MCLNLKVNSHFNIAGDMWFLSAMVMLGANWCWCTDTDKEAHHTTCCSEMSLSMPTSVTQPYSPKY